jgi:ketosteroid isomerase-like protein
MLDLDADALADLYASDAIHEFPFTAPGRLRRYEGREEVRAGYRAAWGASPIRLDEITNVVVHETTDPEVIVAEQEAVGTVTTTGRPFTLAFLLVMRVRDGRIAHVRDYADALGVAQALDRLPGLVESLQARRGADREGPRGSQPR